MVEQKIILVFFLLLMMAQAMAAAAVVAVAEAVAAATATGTTTIRDHITEMEIVTSKLFLCNCFCQRPTVVTPSNLTIVVVLSI